MVTVLVAATCVRLGFWQLDRLAGRRAFNAGVEAGLAAPVAPVDALVDAEGADEAAYRRASATGTWDPAHEVILYGRPLDGRPGDHVLTPLLLSDGRAILVDRGWVPTGTSGPPVEGDGAAVGGTVTVFGTLLPASAETDRAAPAPAVETVRTIDVSMLDAQVPADLLPGVYLLLARQDPAAALPVPAALPALGEGPHLGYAIQWFCFAAIALVGGTVLMRRRREPSARAASETEPTGR